MSYTWVWLLIPIMLWFYSGLFLVRLLGPGFAALLGIANNPEPSGSVQTYNYSLLYME